MLQLEQVNLICKALSSANGARVFFYLADLKIPQHVGAVAAALNIASPLASHHLHSLYRSGLLNRTESGNWTFYSVQPETVHALIETFQQPMQSIPPTTTTTED